MQWRALLTQLISIKKKSNKAFTGLSGKKSTSSIWFNARAIAIGGLLNAGFWRLEPQGILFSTKCGYRLMLRSWYNIYNTIWFLITTTLRIFYLYRFSSSTIGSLIVSNQYGVHCLTVPKNFLQWWWLRSVILGLHNEKKLEKRTTKVCPNESRYYWCFCCLKWNALLQSGVLHQLMPNLLTWAKSKKELSVGPKDITQ